MMEELFIKIKATKLFVFFRDQWWVAVIIAMIAFMFTGVPNILNPQRVIGKIARTYKGSYHASAYGGNSINFDAIYVILEDSSIYHCTAKQVISLLGNHDMVGKYIDIKYSIGNPNDKQIKKLTYRDKIILDDSPIPLYILYSSILWILLGGGAELVRIWKSV